MGLYDFTFYDLINRNAAIYRSHPAWYEADDGRELNFGQVKEHVDRVANGLRKLGLKKGQRLAVLGKNSLEYFILYGAAAALGCILLPINWRLSADEVAHNLNDCEPKILFMDPEFQDLIDGIQDQLESIKTYVHLKTNGDHQMEFSALLNNPAVFEPTAVANDDGFVIIHTAAVAGRPRGALLSHSNVLCANMHLNYLFHLTGEDVHLNLLPLFHVGGLFMATNAFHAGALNINMPKFDAGKAVDLIQAKKVTLLFDFAPILGSIMEASEKSDKNIQSLQAVLGLEAPETIEKYQKLTGGTFFCMYGQTETSCLATLGTYNDRPGSAGKPIQLAEVRLVDDYDRPVPVGQVGEITMKGPMVFKGYWNLPEDNKDTFRGGWHHTGDLGRFDEDGYLWYAGRKAEKELIKPGGENVYPAEVEKTILEHPDVSETIVFGVPDPKWKEGIKAVCVRASGSNLTAEALIEFVAQRIARYKKPHIVEFVETLPKTPDGLIDRVAVKQKYGDAH